MSKYTKGWLCKEKICIKFFWYEPEVEKGAGHDEYYWYRGSVSSKCWLEAEFSQAYSCNFRLPKPGEKVEVEIEL